MARTAVDLDDLSPEEQLDLLGEIWECLSEQPSRVPLSEEQRAELDRRLDAVEADIQAGRALGSPWSEVRARIQSR